MPLEVNDFADILDPSWKPSSVSPKHDKWEPYFDQASKESSVPKSLLKAIAIFENGEADPMAESGTGPAGPMQISRGLAEDLGMLDKDRYDPAISISKAAEHIRSLLDHYNGDEVKTIAAYQVGRGAVDAAGGPTAGDKNISNAGYVQRVQGLREKVRQEELSKVKFSTDDFADLLGDVPVEPAAPQVAATPATQTQPAPQLQESVPAPSSAGSMASVEVKGAGGNKPLQSLLAGVDSYQQAKGEPLAQKKLPSPKKTNFMKAVEKELSEDLGYIGEAGKGTAQEIHAAGSFVNMLWTYPLRAIATAGGAWPAIARGADPAAALKEAWNDEKNSIVRLAKWVNENDAAVNQKIAPPTDGPYKEQARRVGQVIGFAFETGAPAKLPIVGGVVEGKANTAVEMEKAIRATFKNVHRQAETTRQVVTQEQPTPDEIRNATAALEDPAKAESLTPKEKAVHDAIATDSKVIVDNQVEQIRALPSDEDFDKLSPQEQKAAYQAARKQSRNDPLTGLLNRQGLSEEAYKANKPVDTSDAILFDIDHFKKVNDTYGHPVGDDVLQAFGNTLKERLSGSAIVARVGGEEFAVIPLQDASKSGILDIIDQVRNDFAKESFADGKLTGLTFSAGHGKGIKAADAELYNAKNGGRAQTWSEGKKYEPVRLERSDAQEPVQPTPRTVPEGAASQAGPTPAAGAVQAAPEPQKPAGVVATSSPAKEAIEAAPPPVNSEVIAPPTLAGPVSTGTISPNKKVLQRGSVRIGGGGKSPTQFEKDIQHWLSKWWSTDEGAPKSVTPLTEQRKANIESRLKDVLYLVQDLRSAVHRYVKEQIKSAPHVKFDKKAFLAQVNNWLGGQNTEAIPTPLRPAISEIRSKIDAVSTELRNSNAIPEEMKVVFDENMGVWLNRAYQSHSKKNFKRYVEKHAPERIEVAKGYYKREIEALRAENIEKLNVQATELGGEKAGLQSELAVPTKELAQERIKNKIDEIKSSGQELSARYQSILDELQDRAESYGGEKATLQQRLREPLNDTERTKVAEQITRVDKKIENVAKRIEQIANKQKESNTLAADKKRVLEERLSEPFDEKRKGRIQSRLAEIDTKLQQISNDIDANKREVTDKELTGLVNEFLYANEKGSDVFSMGTKLGAANRSILRRRRLDNAPELRALLGETTDTPYANVARSIYKAVSLLEAHKFQKQVREIGLKEGWLVEGAPQGDLAVPIAAKGSESMGPLAGLYTDKNTAKIFSEYNKTEKGPWYLRALITGANSAKISKTVLSTPSQKRNLLSGFFFATANGHWRSVVTPHKGALIALKDLFDRTPREYREELLEWHKRGAIGSGVASNELRALLNDISPSDIDMLVGPSGVAPFKRLFRVMTKLYQYGDDLWKLKGAREEAKDYAAALGKDVTDSEVRDIAAEHVKDLYPNYDKLPRAIRELRRIPVIGDFPSFIWEVYRTTGNRISLATKELNSSNPKIQAIGAKRLAGTLAATIGVSAVILGIKKAFNVQAKDEDMRRHFLPPWSRDNEIIWLGEDEKGRYRYLDLGYLDPHAPIKSAVIAAMRGEKWEEKLLKPMLILLKPFITPGMFANRVGSVLYNQRDDKRQVYNPEDDWKRKLGAGLNYVWEVVEPGDIASLRRYAKALRNTEGRFGSSYTPGTELWSYATGVRVSALDPARNMAFQARDLAKRIKNLPALGYKRGEEAEYKREKEIYEEFMKTIKAARSMKLKDEQIRAALEDAGIGKRIAYALSKSDNTALSFNEYLKQAQAKRSTIRTERTLVHERNISILEGE